MTVSKGERQNPKQVAVLDEHVLLRGLNRGKNIKRTIVEHNAESSMMAINMNICNS